LNQTKEFVANSAFDRLGNFEQHGVFERVFEKNQDLQAAEVLLQSALKSKQMNANGDALLYSDCCEAYYKREKSAPKTGELKTTSGEVRSTLFPLPSLLRTQQSEQRLNRLSRFLHRLGAVPGSETIKKKRSVKSTAQQNLGK